MNFLKGWLKLVALRFTLSNDELSKCLADRRSMDEFRRKASDAKQRMKLHELAGGHCQVNGGAGIPLSFQGLTLKVYSKETVNQSNATIDTSNVINLKTYRLRRHSVSVVFNPSPDSGAANNTCFYLRKNNDQHATHES